MTVDEKPEPVPLSTKEKCVWGAVVGVIFLFWWFIPANRPPAVDAGTYQRYQDAAFVCLRPYPPAAEEILGESLAKETKTTACKQMDALSQILLLQKNGAL